MFKSMIVQAALQFPVKTSESGSFCFYPPEVNKANVICVKFDFLGHFF